MAGIHTTTSPSGYPISANTLCPSSEARGRKACGIPFRLIRSLTAYARPVCCAATTTTSRRFAGSLRDHSWTNSAIAR